MTNTLKKAGLLNGKFLLNVYSKSYLYHTTAIWLMKRRGEGAERKVRKGQG